MKRALDLLIGGIGTIVAALLVALAALLIRLESPGHPIYKQRRVGKDGAPFEIYKLRTMVRGAEFTGAGLAVQEGDDRITRMGAFLRRTSLDELPNLWNVVRGEMSIVGPRPTVQVQVDQYSDRQRGRLKVKPGLTGWAQVNGRAALPWSERIELDLWYVEHQSLKLDLQILARTWRLVLRGDGLYKGETGDGDADGPVRQRRREGGRERRDGGRVRAAGGAVAAAAGGGDPRPLLRTGRSPATTARRRRRRSCAACSTPAEASSGSTSGSARPIPGSSPKASRCSSTPACW